MPVILMLKSHLCQQGTNNKMDINNNIYLASGFKKTKAKRSCILIVYMHIQYLTKVTSNKNW